MSLSMEGMKAKCSREKDKEEALSISNKAASMTDSGKMIKCMDTVSFTIQVAN